VGFLAALGDDPADDLLGVARPDDTRPAGQLRQAEDFAGGLQPARALLGLQFVGEGVEGLGDEGAQPVDAGGPDLGPARVQRRLEGGGVQPPCAPRGALVE
jgi:hypothetical protein